MSNMRLSEFISQTISEIVQGVVDAQTQVGEKKARVNPAGLFWSESTKIYSYTSSREYPTITRVAFDVLLTDIASGEAKGGVGVFLGNIGLGTEAKKGSRTEAINRLQFELLIELPAQLKS